ncbi:6,7-dimethyl-8-ribityllumazine synthase [Natrinema thermotolerans]|uniref:6,7-dimethyl-8-ribityllumazine synthase n=1 Tax=Natrinema thermotolerans TaxID=121872 RepID=A0AAF0PCU1_9EURY|nr:6,7-dimethyl-8-ribityllumazine synthase [Natrinema thermotolerans]ELZ10590.1 6,7-dimethyl-8-ribityllumazine synthase [Natrinema thermotolerans DSM 11552]QCC58102.1 6,7-dimethyl-8-ribityllumazine synthase [Natrinema thermotolerans]WMT09202.1 6,7-dimethyl-8-ribityllumazine synthase [Natrinema thermotolerans]
MITLGLVVAQFNRPITEQMEQEALEAATAAGAEVYETVQVPGAYDAPLAADRLARRDAVDAVAVVGTVITGDTDHDQVITDATAQRLSDVSLERDTPVTLGVTGPGMSAAEARERVENAATAVEGALDLVDELPASDSQQ